VGVKNGKRTSKTEYLQTVVGRPNNSITRIYCRCMSVKLGYLSALTVAKRHRNSENDDRSMRGWNSEVRIKDK